MELEIDNSFTINVHNKSWEGVTVSVGARPFFKLFEGGLAFFWLQWLWSSFHTTEVHPGKKKTVSKVTSWNFIIYKLGSFQWKLYNISVTRKSDGWIAHCATPLHCTWVVDDKGIIQEDDHENRCKFERVQVPAPRNNQMLLV